jgi:DNA processing protein
MIVDGRAEAWVRLDCAGMPVRALHALLREFGAPEAVLAANPAQRRRIVAADAAARLEARAGEARVKATLEWLQDDGHGLVAWDDADYPRALLEIGEPPAVLYCLGRRELLRRPALAIVGSRNATPQGLADAHAFAAALSATGLAIVSGLAIGIDAAAHRGGLAHAGSSIAVVGTGLDRVYPAANRALAHELATHGLLVSEFVPGTPARKHHFPRRNRLVSGLARGVLVVEATLSSGSLITARLAGEQGREVFAVPGSIHSPFSKGCHKLIREGAKLVETAQDILGELGLATTDALAASAAGASAGAAADKAVGRSADVSDPAGRALLTALGDHPADIDTLAARTALSVANVVALLTALELDGRVAPLAGGRWQRRR